MSALTPCAHPSVRGRSPKLAVSCPRQRRGAAAERRLAHSMRRPLRQPPSVRGRSPKLTVSCPRQRRGAAAGRSRLALARHAAGRINTVAAPRPQENKGNRGDDAEVCDQDLLSGRDHRGESCSLLLRTSATAPEKVDAVEFVVGKVGSNESKLMSDRGQHDPDHCHRGQQELCAGAQGHRRRPRGCLVAHQRLHLLLQPPVAWAHLLQPPTTLRPLLCTSTVTT
jgi:hypothetical protein